MDNFCASCFRETVGDVRICPNCAAPRPASGGAIAMVIVSTICIFAGVLSLRMVLCATGATIGLIAIVRAVQSEIV